MGETLAWLVGGAGAGWVASWVVVVRPLVNKIAEMRYEGFVHTGPPMRKTKPRHLEMNET